MKTSADETDVTTDFGADDMSVEGEGGLSAPVRAAPLSAVKAGGGAKKGVLLGLLVLVAGGLGGGYYYLNTMAGDVAPPVAAQVAVPAVAPAVVAQPQDPVDKLLSTAESDDFALAVPPQPEAVQNEQGPALPQEDLSQPAAPAAVAAGSDVVAPVMPAVEVAAQTQDEAMDALGAPPAEEVVPALPAGMMVAPLTEGAMPPLPPIVETVPDLTPENTAGAEQPLAEPSAAELALAQNAPLLAESKSDAPPSFEDLSAINKMVEQPAIVRNLPKEYLVVHKDRNADDVDSRLTAARLSLSQGRNQAALQFFNELYQQNPRDKRVMMGRAVALQKLGQTENALTAYEEVLADDPKNLEALTNMLGLIKTQDPALALEKLQELRDIYPYNADITAQLGVAQGENGNYKEALKYLNMADALKPGSAYVLFNKAVLYDKMGQSTQAADIYRQIVRMSVDGNLDAPLPIDRIKNRLATMR